MIKLNELLKFILIEKQSIDWLIFGLSYSFDRDQRTDYNAVQVKISLTSDSLFKFIVETISTFAMLVIMISLFIRDEHLCVLIIFVFIICFAQVWGNDKFKKKIVTVVFSILTM